MCRSLRAAMVVLFISLQIWRGHSQGDKKCEGTQEVDLVFLPDSSGSINKTASASGRYENWDLSLKFLTGIVDRVDVGGRWRIGLVLFGNEARNQFYLDTYNNSADIKNAILNTPFLDQFTNTSGAIRRARTEQFVRARGDRPEAPNVSLILTDGNPTKDENLTIPEARMAHSESILVFSVGVTTEVDKMILANMSSPPHQQGVNWFVATNFDALSSIEQEIADEACVVIVSSGAKPSPPCPKPPTDNLYKLVAIISSIVAGVALLSLATCGCLVCSLYQKISALKNAKP